MQTVAYKYSNDIHKIEDDENKKFSSLGLDYIEAEKKLNKILMETIGRNYSRNDDSIHLLLFSALSIKRQYSRILEIGTSAGQFTKFLSLMFPESKIVTVDLPIDDPLLRNLYNRDNEDVYKAFLKAQEKNTDSSNIELIRANSFFLPEKINNTFDLIWVDGGHLYPEIAWDLCNAYHLCKTDGCILYDDVILSQKPIKDKYVSNDSYKVIEYLCDRSKSSASYFLKRLSPKWNSKPIDRKHVAFIEKR